MFSRFQLRPQSSSFERNNGRVSNSDPGGFIANNSRVSRLSKCLPMVHIGCWVPCSPWLKCKVSRNRLEPHRSIQCARPIVVWTRYATYQSNLVLPCRLVSLGKGLEKDTEFKSTYHLVCYDTVDVSLFLTIRSIPIGISWTNPNTLLSNRMALARAIWWTKVPCHVWMYRISHTQMYWNESGWTNGSSWVV